MKSCLPPLYIYLEIDGIVLPKRKKLIGISQDDYDPNVMFFQFVQSFISMSNNFCKLLFLRVCFGRSSRVKVFFFSL